MRFRVVPKSSTLDDPERPWTAKTHSGAEKMRFLEPTTQIWMKIVNHEETIVMGLSSSDCSEDRTIVAGVVLAWYQRVTDRRSDGQTVRQNLSWLIQRSA